jgi:hypothetical protein
MSGTARPPANPSLRVVEVVADAEGIDPTELEPPLYESIDPTALDDLFDASTDPIAARDACLRFDYCGYDVTVRSNGAVDLE